MGWKMALSQSLKRPSEANKIKLAARGSAQATGPFVKKPKPSQMLIHTSRLVEGVW